MPTGEGLPQIAHAIQLAIAPVFLLTGIAALLGVMANRLARVIDRGRALEESWRTFDEHARTLARAELVSSSAGASLRAGPSTTARRRRCWSAS